MPSLAMLLQIKHEGAEPVPCVTCDAHGKSVTLGARFVDGTIRLRYESGEYILDGRKIIAICPRCHDSTFIWLTT